MSFALIFFGLMLMVSSVRCTYTCLFQTLVSDFTGSGSYLYWAAAILILGLVGYSEKLKPLSDGLLVLIILGMIFTGNRAGLFNQLTSALATVSHGSGVTSASTTINTGSLPTASV